MAGAVLELSDDTFQQDVLQSKEPVLVDFWAAWCGPCRMVTPIVEDLAKTYQGRLKVGKMNVDDHTVVASNYQVMNIPTLIFFKGGQEVDRIVGVAPRDEFVKRVDQILKG